MALTVMCFRAREAARILVRWLAAALEAASACVWKGEKKECEYVAELRERGSEGGSVDKGERGEARRVRRTGVGSRPC